MLDLFPLFADWYKHIGLWSFPQKISSAVSHMFIYMSFLFRVFSFLFSLFRFSFPLWSRSCRFRWLVCFPLFHFQVVGAFLVIHFWVVFTVIREFRLHYFNFWEFAEVSFVGVSKASVQGHLKWSYVLWVGRGSLAPTLQNYLLINDVMYVFYICSHLLDPWSLMNRKKTNLLLVFSLEFSLLFLLFLLYECRHYVIWYLKVIIAVALFCIVLYVFFFALIQCFCPKLHRVWWFLSGFSFSCICPTGLSSSFIFNTFK